MISASIFMKCCWYFSQRFFCRLISLLNFSLANWHLILKSKLVDILLVFVGDLLLKVVKRFIGSFSFVMLPECLLSWTEIVSPECVTVKFFFFFVWFLCFSLFESFGLTCPTSFELVAISLMVLSLIWRSTLLCCFTCSISSLNRLCVCSFPFSIVLTIIATCALCSVYSLLIPNSPEDSSRFLSFILSIVSRKILSLQV